MAASGRARAAALAALLALAPSAGRAEPALAAARQPAEPERGPDPVHETVVRAAAPVDETPAERRVGRERIERSAARSLAEVLEREAGLHGSTGVRGERQVQLRGFDQRQLLVLIDGVPAALPFGGVLDLGKLPATLVEDVVVLRPPGSLRFGPSGMGGTISVRTREPGAGPVVGTRFEGGPGRDRRLEGVHSYRLGPVSWLLGAGVDSREAYPLSSRFEPTPTEDGGPRDRSDRRLVHGLARARLDLARGGRLEATAFRVEGAWGIPPSTVAPRPRHWRVTDWATTVASLTHRWRPAPGLVLHETAFVALFDDLLDAYDDASLTSQDRVDSFHSRFHDLGAGGTARLRWSLPREALVRLEAAGRYERHRAEQLLGGRLEPDRDEVDRAVVVLSAQLEAPLSASVRLVGGLEAELEAGLARAAEPGAGALLALRYEPSGAPLALGLSVARRARLPTLKERFSEAGGAGTPARLPNPELGPEVALHLGLDARVRPTRWVALELAAFDSEVRDLIQLVGLDPGTDQLRNLARARLAGLELRCRLSPLRWLELEAAYGYLHARELGEDGGAGPLPYRPEHLAAAWLRLRPSRWLELSTGARLVGPQRFRGPGSSRWRELGPFVVWDARVEGELRPGVRAWLQATNLLDYDYQTEHGYPEPGLQLRAGLRLELGRPTGELDAHAGRE